MTCILVKFSGCSVLLSFTWVGAFCQGHRSTLFAPKLIVIDCLDDDHRHKDDHRTRDQLFHLHNLQTLNLRLFSAIFLFVLSLRVFLSLWRSSGICGRGVYDGMLYGQKKVSFSSLDVIAHFHVLPVLIFFKKKSSIFHQCFVHPIPSLACLSFSFHFQELQVSMGPSQRGSVNVFLNLWVLEKMKNLYVLDVDNVNQDQSLR